MYQKINRILDNIFPYRNIRNIAMFYILSSVYSAWIIAGVWVFIWGAFMTKSQIGISDSITFTVGFLVELPSGVLADMIGRRKAIVIGNILLTLGNLFVTFSSSFLSITAWYLVWTIGYAFQSGATEAHAYDSLKKAGHQNEWKKVISSSVVIGRITTLISTALGGYLFSLGFRIPYLVTTIVSAIGILAALLMTEIQIKKPKKFWSLDTYISQIKDGVFVLFRPNIMPITMIAISIMGAAFMYNWGLLRPLTAERFGFTPQTYSLLLSLTSLVGVIAISILRHFQEKVKLVRFIFIIGIMYALLFTVMGLPHGLIGGGMIQVTIAVLLMYMDILFSQFINKHTNEKHRATTLSAVALLTKLPYVLLAIVIGRVAENNNLPTLTIITGTIMLIIWFISITLLSKITTKKYATREA